MGFNSGFKGLIYFCVHCLSCFEMISFRFSILRLLYIAFGTTVIFSIITNVVVTCSICLYCLMWRAFLYTPDFITIYDFDIADNKDSCDWCMCNFLVYFSAFFGIIMTATLLHLLVIASELWILLLFTVLTLLVIKTAMWMMNA